MAKVVYVGDDGIRFEGQIYLSSDHHQDCCEHHYLDFSDLVLSDFEGLDFDLPLADIQDQMLLAFLIYLKEVVEDEKERDEKIVKAVNDYYSGKGL